MAAYRERGFGGPESRNEPTCPLCRARPAVPFSVESANGGRVIVTFRCQSCSHEWQVLRPDGPVHGFQ